MYDLCKCSYYILDALIPQENKENIIGILGLDMPSAPVKHPVIAKVEAQTQRSRKDLKELLKFSSSDLLVSKIRALESELEQTYRTPSVQFQMASSIGALAVKYQTEEMPEADVIRTCDEISGNWTILFYSPLCSYPNTRWTGIRTIYFANSEIFL